MKLAGDQMHIGRVNLLDTGSLGRESGSVDGGSEDGGRRCSTGGGTPIHPVCCICLPAEDDEVEGGETGARHLCTLVQGWLWDGLEHRGALVLLPSEAPVVVRWSWGRP